MTRKATLIVLAWNRWELTRRCLETLRETDLSEAEVLVVDNGSSDETPRQLAQLDWVRHVRLSENLGFVRGNNAGIERADPESDVVLLNNDLVFEQRDWLQRLRACAHGGPDHGVVGCRLCLPDGRLLHAGTYVLPDTLWGQQIGALEKDVGQYPRTRDVEGIVFACAYLRREVIRAIGGLAERYGSYFEDTDYCLRARAAGFRTLVCGEVSLVHDEHGSTSGEEPLRKELFAASRRTFGQTWRKVLEAGYRHEVLWQSILNFPTGYARQLPRAVVGARGRGRALGLPLHLRQGDPVPGRGGSRDRGLLPERRCVPAPAPPPLRRRRLRAGRRVPPQPRTPQDRLHDARG